jgi:Ohr subfamily peroxiredoxin
VPAPFVEEIYTANVTVEGGREGRARNADGTLDLQLVTPGDDETTTIGTNPEELFAAGYAACFQSALGLVASAEEIDTSASRIDASVTLGKDADEHYDLAVTLRLTIPGVDAATARRLVEAAHQICPYSRATRGNIDVQLDVVTN